MVGSQTHPFWLGGKLTLILWLFFIYLMTYHSFVEGVAASMAACCTHPLDLTKVRMQTLTREPGTKPPSTLRVLHLAVVEDGIRSLYTGLSASILRQMSYSLVRLGSYDVIKGALAGDGRASTGQLLLAAGIAGGLGGVAGNPADIVLVRMTSDQLRPPQDRYGYPNALRGLVSLVREEGAKGLYRGVGTNTARAILMNVSQVGSYDFFKSSLIGTQVPFSNRRFGDGIGLHTLCSVTAGFFATTICAPFDVMKSRLMSVSHAANPVDLFLKSLREEGPRFLFKGWTPAFVRLGPNTVLLFVFFEQLKKLWA